MLATAFLSGKSWGTPAEQAPRRRGRSGFTAAPGSPWPPLLLAASVTSQLCWLLGGVKPKQNMCAEPQKAGRLVSRPTLPSPKSGPLSGGAPSSAEQGWPGHGRCGRRTPAFLPLGRQLPQRSELPIFTGDREWGPLRRHLRLPGSFISALGRIGGGEERSFWFFLMYFEMTRILSLLKCQTCKTVFRKRTCLKESEGVSYHLGFGRSLY